MDRATLPKELLATIFSFLNCKDLTAAVCVNSTWNSLASHESIWKESMFNSSFPHPYSYSQKDVSWRQLVKRHFQTKKNITNRRCVQHTLGTRCKGAKARTDTILRNQTANDKYCLLVWEVMESHGYSYSTHDHIATELWDIKTRTIVKNFSQERLELYHDYTLEQSDHNYEEDKNEIFFTKFDPEQQLNSNNELILNNSIKTTNLNYGCFPTLIQNEERTSSLIALTWTNWELKKLFIHFYDLRTGSKILAKDYDDKTHWTIEQFYGNKLLMRSRETSNDSLLVLDVIQNTEITVKESHVSCSTLAGDELWMVIRSKKALVKYNTSTKQRKKYNLSMDFINLHEIRIYDGIIWIFYNGANVALFSISSASKCTHLAMITLPGWNSPDVTQLSNGTLVLLTSSYVRILSFNDDDIEVPIQVLQIQTNGENEILNIPQGDLNKTIAGRATSHEISSQIVFEDETQRYCVIYSYNEKEKVDMSNNNKYADAARDWCKDTVTYHKAALFQLVHFDNRTGAIDHPTSNRPAAIGPCWIIYETKVNGAWQRAAPVDYWTFFKNKLGLK